MILPKPRPDLDVATRIKMIVATQKGLRLDDVSGDLKLGREGGSIGMTIAFEFGLTTLVNYNTTVLDLIKEVEEELKTRD